MIREGGRGGLGPFWGIRQRARTWLGRGSRGLVGARAAFFGGTAGGSDVARGGSRCFLGGTAGGSEVARGGSRWFGLGWACSQLFTTVLNAVFPEFEAVLSFVPRNQRAH